MPQASRGELPPITLSIPYYSGFALTLRTLQSIAAQTHADCRVLVCDDSPSGLTADEREAVASAVGGKFPLKVLRNEQNLGMARTWNRCIDAAETDLVTIVHGDDELDPEYAGALAALLVQHPEAAAGFCGAAIIGIDGASKFSFPDLYKQVLIPRHDDVLSLRGDGALHSLMRGNYIFCPSLCYRRSQLGDTRFDRRFRMVQDFDLTTRLLLAGKTLVGMPERKLYRYRRHEDNATEHLTKELTRFREEAAFFLDVARRAREVGYVQSARTAERRRIIKLNLLFCIARDLSSREFRDAGEKARMLRSLFTSV